MFQTLNSWSRHFNIVPDTLFLYQTPYSCSRHFILVPDTLFLFQTLLSCSRHFILVSDTLVLFMVQISKFMVQFPKCLILSPDNFGSFKAICIRNKLFIFRHKQIWSTCGDIRPYNLQVFRTILHLKGFAKLRSIFVFFQGH